MAALYAMRMRLRVLAAAGASACLLVLGGREGENEKGVEQVCWRTS